MFVFADLETTGLLEPEGINEKHQPKIIELYLRKTTKELKFVDEIETLINPRRKIPGFISRINDIWYSDIRNAPVFKDVIKPLNKFLEGTTLFVAHNASFDYTLLEIEANREKAKLNLPKTIFCTIEQSGHIIGRRLNLERIHFLATGKYEIKGYHGAKTDVMALIDCFEWLINSTWEEQQEKAKLLPDFENHHSKKKK